MTEALFEAIPHPAILAACEQGIQLANTPGQMLLDLVEPFGELPRRVQDLLNKACDENREIHSASLTDAVLVRVNERERFYLVDIRKAGHALGDEDLYLVLLTDVTKFRYLSDLQANPLATVAHEVKTPITGMHLAVSLLLEERGGKLENLQRKLLESAQDDCLRLLDTLEGLLDMAGFTLGSAGINARPEEPNSVVAEAVADLESEAVFRGVRIEVEAEESLPEILIDRQKLVVAIKSIMSNAIRFSPAKEEVRITIARKGAHHVRFSVYDQGLGVSLDQEGKIFERFYTCPTDKSPGIGLGLSVAREIVEAHGGALGIDRSGKSPHPFYIDVPRV